MQKDLKFKENVVHGNMQHPFVRYRTEFNEASRFYPIHWHEEMEILKVQAGTASICIDGEFYPAAQGDILILMPFAMHSIHVGSSGNLTLDAFVFNLRLLETLNVDMCTLKYFAPMLNAKQSQPCIIRTDSKNYAEFNTSVDSLLSADAAAEGVELQIKSSLYFVFYLIYSLKLVKVENNPVEDKRYYTIKKLLQTIRSNYMNEIDIVALAEQSGYSEFYLMKLFKKFTGNTIVDYVNQYRLDIAGKLLLETDDDIAAIAYQVGFNNISYFNRQFKGLFQMTPKQFRKVQREGG